MHRNPRRYPLAHSIDWKSRIVYDAAEFIIVDKPSGVPCHATLDNAVENLIEKLEGLSLSSGGLWLPHRLDLDTSGLMVVAKSAKLCASLGKYFTQRNIHKRYAARVRQVNHATPIEVATAVSQSR